MNLNPETQGSVMNEMLQDGWINEWQNIIDDVEVIWGWGRLFTLRWIGLGFIFSTIIKWNKKNAYHCPGPGPGSISQHYLFVFCSLPNSFIQALLLMSKIQRATSKIKIHSRISCAAIINWGIQTKCRQWIIANDFGDRCQNCSTILLG